VGLKLQPKPAARIHGGSSHECYQWHSSSGPIFVKVAAAESQSMLSAEAAGLEELRRADAVRVPRVLGAGISGADAWLALEWIQFGVQSRAAEVALGQKLALQHRRHASAFGWNRDNTIGSTPQLNAWMDDWVVFFREKRLRHQLALAAQNGYTGVLQRRGETLLDLMVGFFSAYQPMPSLLHGDLWGGNWACDQVGAPVIFDPALYYGDREADLAMTRLFGGFGADFRAAYASEWELDAGVETRVDLYNLYHVLNHLNLFGRGYLAQALAMTEGLLAELGH